MNKEEYIQTDSTRRCRIRDNEIRRFEDLQTSVQHPHNQIDYSKHINCYRHKDKPFLIGWELEIEHAPIYSKLKALLAEHLGDTSFYVCTDGSLRNNGNEIVSLPFPEFEWRLRYVKIHSLIQKLHSMGCRSHDTTTCGLHFSVSADVLPVETWKQIQAFINTHQRFFKLISRRENFQYCKFEESNGDRYRALNLSPLLEHNNQSSSVPKVEFRFFRGTLVPQHFLASLECVLALVTYFQEIYELPEYAAQLTLQKFKKFVLQSEYRNLKRYLNAMGLLPIPKPRKTRTKYTPEERAQRKTEVEAERARRLAERAAKLEAKNKALDLQITSLFWQSLAYNGSNCFKNRHSILRSYIPNNITDILDLTLNNFISISSIPITLVPLKIQTFSGYCNEDMRTRALQIKIKAPYVGENPPNEICISMEKFNSHAATISILAGNFKLACI